MNRRRLDFGGPIQEDGDAIHASASGAGVTSAQVQIHQGSDSLTAPAIGAQVSSGQGQYSSEYGGTMVNGGPSSTGGAPTTEILLGHGMWMPPRGLGVGKGAGTSVAGTSRQILMTPQQAATSAAGTSSRGMLTPLEAAIGGSTVHTCKFCLS
jgi:hypothetical protein